MKAPRKKNNFPSSPIKSKHHYSISPSNILSPSKSISISAQDVLIEEILHLCCDTSILDGKELKDKILLLLDVKMKNEYIISRLLQEGVKHDKIGVQQAAAINNRSKDSVSDLYKLVEKLPGSQSDVNVNVKVESEEINEAIRRARKQMAEGSRQ